MAYSVNTPLTFVSPSGTAAEALAWLDVKSGPETEYVNALWESQRFGILDPAILFAQAAWETGDFSSPRWFHNHNPAGLGIEADDDRDPAQLTGAEAALLHAWALLYATRRTHTGHYPTQKARAFMDRWVAKVEDPNFPHPVLTIADLGKHYVDSHGEPQAVWGWDPEYARGIVGKLNRIFPNRQEVTPMGTLTFGKVPYPDVVPSHLPASNPYVKTAGAPDVPEAVVWHRMIGTWAGTDDWFHKGHAATAYGVAVEATDGANAGKIFEWIAPRTGWYGESSGPVDEPYGDGLALVNLVGVASVNRTTKAIEISGNYDTPLDEKARAAIVNMTAYWADQKKIPWDAFPIIPGTDRSFVVWHQEITIGSGKVCPGTVVMNETSALIERVRGVLKQYQVGAKPSKPTGYAPSVLPEWWDESLTQVHPTDKRVGEDKYWAMRRSFVAHTVTTRRSAPDPTAPVSGPKVQLREKVFGERQVNDDWLLTVDGHYILTTKMAPRVKLRN